MSFHEQVQAEQARCEAAIAGGSVVHQALEQPAPCLKTFTLESLVKEKIAELRWAVMGLIPEGLTIVAAPPKMFKSWFMLHICMNLPDGRPVLGCQVVPGEALYIALEDGKRRLQERYHLLAPDGMRPSPKVHLALQCPRLNAGGLAFIRAFLEKHPAVRVVIIDTLGKVRPSRKHGASIYDEDVDALGPLQALALEMHVAIVVVSHTRKGGSEDFLESITGSNGQAGCADAVIIFKRSRCQNDLILEVTGRDLPEKRIAVHFEPGKGTFEATGDAEEVAMSRERAAVMEAFRQAGHPMTPAEIAIALNIPRTNAKSLIYKMEREGVIRSLGYRSAYEPVSTVATISTVATMATMATGDSMATVAIAGHNEPVATGEPVDIGTEASGHRGHRLSTVTPFGVPLRRGDPRLPPEWRDKLGPREAVTLHETGGYSVSLDAPDYCNPTDPRPSAEDYRDRVLRPAKEVQP